MSYISYKINSGQKCNFPLPCRFDEYMKLYILKKLKYCFFRLHSIMNTLSCDGYHILINNKFIDSESGNYKGKLYEDYYLIKYGFLQYIFEWVDVHKIACTFCKKGMDDRVKNKRMIMKFMLKHINHIIIHDLQKLVENILIPHTQTFPSDRIHGGTFYSYNYGLDDRDVYEQLTINFVRSVCIICKKYFHAIADKELLIFHLSKCFYEKCIWLEKRYDAKLK